MQRSTILILNPLRICGACPFSLIVPTFSHHVTNAISSSIRKIVRRTHRRTCTCILNLSVYRSWSDYLSSRTCKLSDMLHPSPPKKPYCPPTYMPPLAAFSPTHPSLPDFLQLLTWRCTRAVMMVHVRVHTATMHAGSRLSANALSYWRQDRSVAPTARRQWLPVANR